MDNFDLMRPTGIDSQAWAAIVSHRDRLTGAIAGADRSLTLGRAKELAESVARVVITERGDVAPANMDFPHLIDTAHVALQRQPGIDLSQDTALRNLVQGAMKIVKSIAEIRNSFGSGHGRPREPIVVEEMVEVTVAATFLWVRWALRRLAPLIFGQPTPLIKDLLGGHTFYKGDLANRLVAANIVALEEPIQQKLGTAVAQRAMHETFLVRIEGVEACAESPSMEAWPLSYRRGVVDGLLFDEAGEVRTISWALTLIPDLLGPVRDQEAEIDRLTVLLGQHPIRTGDWNKDYPLHQQALALAKKFDPQASLRWTKIAGLFEPEPPF
ncbi:abortive infection family protein [Nocardia vulneris]|uniref:abortive infection family protein n=1 Tax=Nocardia vulneris TaxID=1141657 RepID=UPI0030D44943